MRNIGVLVQTHAVGIVLAAALAIVCVAPFYYFTTNPQYRGITLMGADAEDHYLARMQEVYEGRLSIGNAYLPEKNVPYFVPSGGEIISSIVGLLFLQTAPNAEMLNKFIFPFLGGLAFYVLGFIVSGSVGAGLLFAATGVFGDGTLLSGLSAWKNLAQGITTNINFLGYTRPVNPEITELCLVLGFLLCYRIFLVRTARDWESVALVGIIGGGVYLSPFLFTFLGMVLFMLFVWLAYKGEKALAVRAGGIGMTALLFSVPFYFNYRALTSAAAYGDSALRQGLVISHTPIIGTWLPILLLCTLFFWPKRYRLVRPLIIAASLSLLIFLNQQLITGHTIQPGHYHWYITIPLVFMALSLYATYFIERFVPSRGWRITLYALGIGVLFYNAVLTQYSSYRHWLPQATAAQAYAPIFDALNALPPGQVVWSNPEIAMYIPIYTHSDAPNSVQMSNYLVPLSYLEDRLFLSYRLLGLTAVEASTTMAGSERAHISSALYSIYWLQQTGSFNGIPNDIISKVAADYRAESIRPLQSLFKKLGITTVVWDKAANPEWRISSFSFMQKMYSSGNLEVYEILY